MSDGYLPFKGLALGAAAIAVGVAAIPSTSKFSFDSMTSIEKDPLRFTKKSGSTSGGTTTTSGGTTTTSGGSLSGSGTTTTTTTTTTTNPLGYSELSMIPSNFDVSTELVSAPIPGSAAPDVVGAFRFICNAGQILADDPIVYPGQPGKSHLHQFYGNTTANAYSTYSSLRAAGSSTCMSPLNRSAYWMPAMLDGKGNVVRPDYVSIYYKRRPATDPKCSLTSGDSQAEGNCVPLPNGLRFIFGWDPTGANSAKTGEAYFNCDGPTAKPGVYATIPQAMANCPAGNRLGAVIQAPECWDGKNLDSADHRSHVSYPDYGTWGYLKCDSAHPYVIPTFKLGAWYTIASTDNTSLWTLSSDAMAPGQPAGYTFHADWFGAWDNTVESMWIGNCINKLLNCSGGVLGNGYQMKMYSGFTWTASPRLVPIPA